MEETNGAERWERVALTSRPQLVVNGLPSYVPQRFRVCAVGTKTESPYSPGAWGKAS